MDFVGFGKVERYRVWQKQKWYTKSSSKFGTPGVALRLSPMLIAPQWVLQKCASKGAEKCASEGAEGVCPSGRCQQRGRVKECTGEGAVHAPARTLKECASEGAEAAEGVRPRGC